MFAANAPFDWSVIIDGLLISAIGYIVVLIALAGLYYVFRYILPNVLHLETRSRLRRQGRQLPEGENPTMIGDVSAAIAMALYLYVNELHDEENTVMTIKKVAKTYSPWSSKIYGVTNRKT